MNGNDFIRITNQAFVPFLKDLGFVVEAPLVSGRYYRVNFTRNDYVISVSYEPGDEVLFVIIFSCEDGELSNIDDRIKTPRLADLNREYMPIITDTEHIENCKRFESVIVNDKEESLLLKAAKELCLVLPKYLCS